MSSRNCVVKFLERSCGSVSGIPLQLNYYWFICIIWLTLFTFILRWTIIWWLNDLEHIDKENHRLVFLASRVTNNQPETVGSTSTSRFLVTKLIVVVGTRKKSNAIEIVCLMNIIYNIAGPADLIAHCIGFWYSVSMRGWSIFHTWLMNFNPADFIEWLLVFKAIGGVRGHFGSRVYQKGSYVITHVRWSVFKYLGYRSSDFSETLH